MLGNARLPQGLFKDKPFKSYAVPLLLGGAALAAAVAGGLIVGGEGGIDGVNGFVEKLSGGSTTNLGDIAPSRIRVRICGWNGGGGEPLWFCDAPCVLESVPRH